MEGNKLHPTSDVVMERVNDYAIEKLRGTNEDRMRREKKVQAEDDHVFSSSESYAVVVGKRAEQATDGKMKPAQGTIVSGSLKTISNAHRGNSVMSVEEGKIQGTGHVKNIIRGKDRVVGRSYEGTKSYDYGVLGYKKWSEVEEWEIVQRKGGDHRGGEKRKEPHGDWMVVQRKKSPPKGYH